MTDCAPRCLGAAVHRQQPAPSHCNTVQQSKRGGRSLRPAQSSNQIHIFTIIITCIQTHSCDLELSQRADESVQQRVELQLSRPRSSFAISSSESRKLREMPRWSATDDAASPGELIGAACTPPLLRNLNTRASVAAVCVSKLVLQWLPLHV